MDTTNGWNQQDTLTNISLTMVQNAVISGILEEKIALIYQNPPKQILMGIQKPQMGTGILTQAKVVVNLVETILSAWLWRAMNSTICS